MNDYLSSAPIVLYVVGKTECLLTKDRGKFLLLLDLLFVKDSAELVERILCVTAERRDVLRGILPDIDGAGRDGRRCPAARVALDGHGDVRCTRPLVERLEERGTMYSKKRDDYSTVEYVFSWVLKFSTEISIPQIDIMLIK